MSQIIILLTMLTSSMIFLQMNHPLAMGLMLLAQTVLISLTAGLLTYSFWFSYVLFLIFLGGMLVLFIYVTSLASNEMFSLSTNLLTLSLFMMTIFMISIMIIDLNFLTNWTENMEMNSIMTINLLEKENSINLNKLYNYPTNLITILLIIYLLITLVVSVKITNIFGGPLRQMN